jgi:hypothetical protein
MTTITDNADAALEIVAAELRDLEEIRQNPPDRLTMGPRLPMVNGDQDTW